MMTKLKKSGVRALTLFLTVLMALQLSAVTTFATPADECDHEYIYDLQFDFYELNYTTEYICLNCYNVFEALSSLSENYVSGTMDLSSHCTIYGCAMHYTSGKILTSITHYTAYAYDVEGFEEYEGEDWSGLISADSYESSWASILNWENVVDGDYVGVSYGSLSAGYLRIQFDSITSEEIPVTAEPVTGQFYSSNGYTGLKAHWVLWDGETDLTESEADTLTETKTMYYYTTGGDKYYPFSGYEKPWVGETVLTKTCTECGRVAVSDGCVHDYDNGVVTTKATCTEDGVMTYTCSDCGFSYTTSIKATGHTAGNAVKENVVDAACTTDGSYDSVVYCETCGEEMSRETVTVSKTGHTADSTVTENYVAATCTKSGSYDTVVYCKTCGVEMSRVTTTVAATGHNYTSSVTKAATCTTAGTRTYTCSKCGDSYTESIPATGHTYTSSVTKAATCTTAGTRTYTCSECGDSYTESIPATGHTWNDGVVTTEATHSATGVKTYTCTNCGATKTETIAKVTFLFDDVKDSSVYYYDAVYWAYDNGITTGTSTTMFSPSAGCTRAQFVTFLYRLAGEPAPTTTSCKFTDVSSSGYYYNAVLWAAENGVTEGTTSTTFSPNAKITRAQAVTMIYRYAGSPSVSTTNPFSDVSENSYYTSILWAVKNGITSGTTKTTFSPNTTCSRAMMVTFLYRFAG